jgi:hypothetical protein
MKTFRLTAAIRDEIIEDMISHRYLEECHEHIMHMKCFAEAVYEDIYSEKTRAEFEALPKGWLPESTMIKVIFGNSHAELNFNGLFETRYSNQEFSFLKDFDTKVYQPISKRLPDKDKGSWIKRYEANSSMAIEYDQLINDRKTIIAEMKDSKTKLGGVLNSFSSSGPLVESWPEIAPFLKKFIKEPAPLPAIPVESFNATFKLPITTENKIAA